MIGRASYRTVRATANGRLETGNYAARLGVTVSEDNGMMRAMARIRALIPVLVLVMAACSARADVRHGHSAHPGRPSASASARPEAPISARIELPSATLAAGTTLSGRIVVSNDTGHPITGGGCGSPFAVLLVSDEIHPMVAWPSCLERITLPVGVSTWKVDVSGSYSSCGGGGASVPCLNGRTPPLPPGDYRATFFQLPHLVPRPAPIDVVVTTA
jgi:hypothetical protein